MTTKQLEGLGFSHVVDAGEKEITGGFCGDLLSWAIGRAKSGDCWFTVMGNLNTIAVATLVDVAAVVLCQDVKFPGEALEKAKEEGIAVLYTDLPVYEAATAFSDLFRSK